MNQYVCLLPATTSSNQAANSEYNEFYTPEVAQWLADNAAMNSLHPTVVPLPHQASREINLVSRQHGTTSRSYHFNPYSMASRTGRLLRRSPTALWVGGQRGFECSASRAFHPQGLQSIGPTIGAHTGPSTVYAGSSSLPLLGGYPNYATSNGDSSTARLCATPCLDIQQDPHPSWIPFIQPAPQHSLQNPSATSGTAHSVVHSPGCGQLSASSSRVASWPEIEPSPSPVLDDGHHASHLPIFTPRPTPAPTPNISADPSEGDFSEAGPSSRPLESLRRPVSITTDGRSSSSSSSPDVQRTSTMEVAEPSGVEEDTGVSTERAWFSPEEFAENHTWNILCRLARDSKTRGLFDATGTALDPTINQSVECGEVFEDPAAFVQHLERHHRVTNAKHGQNGNSKCAWGRCTSEMTVGSYHRHVTEKHAMHWRCPYKECTERQIRKGVNRTIGGTVQSYARINLLENHIRSHHSSDDLVTMKAAYGDGWKLAYAVLTPQIGGVPESG
ncbi:unnamed protein product [Cyclocybe aegerita]|uniref:Uncharacterized protein n=1 Tax=Cyclocybe aegerita TaxID=1973307 RepID=A0A8S0W469_CYCAE|nr:unnamed protein product [Cyclocybe aegerita]